MSITTAFRIILITLSICSLAYALRSDHWQSYRQNFKRLEADSNITNDTADCAKYVSINPDAVSLFGFSCEPGSPEDPPIPEEVMKYNTEYAVADLSFNTYTRIPYYQVCQFVNLYRLDFNHNNLSSLKKIFVNLKCLSELIELDLSSNSLGPRLDDPDDFDDRFCGQLEELDLGYNKIESVSPSVFFKTRKDPVNDPWINRFPNLNYLNLHGNQLKIFDLLLPLTFPNKIFLFDVSGNPISSFENTFGKSFKNSLFKYDFKNSNRTFLIRTANITRLDDNMFYNYGVQSKDDLEMFLDKILYYDFVRVPKILICECPTMTFNMAVWFKQIANVDGSSSLFDLACSNIKQPSVIPGVDDDFNNKVFALNYDCGEWDTILSGLRDKARVIYLRSSRLAFYQSLSENRLREAEYLKSFEQVSIVGDFLNQAPARLLSAKWNQDSFADLGNLFHSNQIVNEPRVEWLLSKNQTSSYFTLMLVDIDSPIKEERSSNYQSLHWLVVNIVGNKLPTGKTKINYYIDQGEIICRNTIINQTYFKILNTLDESGLSLSKTFQNNDYHRLVFLVYEQKNGMIDASTLRISESKFKANKFIQNNLMPNPIAGNYFYLMRKLPEQPQIESSE